MEVVVSQRQNGTRRIQLMLDQESKVEQSHRKECNINTIVARAKRTGLWPRVVPGSYGDFSGAAEYQEIQDRLIAARQDFMQLPAEIRSRFGNDPGALLDFVNDPGNVQEARKLGLLPKEAPEEIVAKSELGEPEATSGKTSEPAAA